MSAIFTDIDVPYFLIVEHVTQEEFDAAGLTDWLTEEELAHYRKLKGNTVAKRGRQWLLGRYAAKVACRRWLEGEAEAVVDWKNIHVNNEAGGMPLLSVKGISDPPALSISHSDDEAVAAVTKHGYPVGVDIETRIPRKGLSTLARRISSDSEYHQCFDGVEDKEFAERFVQVWVAKEATAKCTGKGLQWRPKLFEVERLSDEVVVVCHANKRYSVMFSKRNNYVIGLARKVV